MYFLKDVNPYFIKWFSLLSQTNGINIVLSFDSYISERYRILQFVMATVLLYHVRNIVVIALL